MCVRGEEVMKREKKLHPNLDYYAAPVYYLLGIPIELFTPVFLAARTIGISAHVMEQHDNNRLFRPRVHYTGTSRSTPSSAAELLKQKGRIRMSSSGYLENKEMTFDPLIEEIADYALQKRLKVRKRIVLPSMSYWIHLAQDYSHCDSRIVRSIWVRLFQVRAYRAVPVCLGRDTSWILSMRLLISAV